MEISPLDYAHSFTLWFFALERNVVGARKILAKLDIEDHNVKTSLYHFVTGNKIVKIGESYSSALACLDMDLVIDEGDNAYLTKLFFTRALLNTWYERLESAVSDCTSALGVVKRVTLEEIEKAYIFNNLFFFSCHHNETSLVINRESNTELEEKDKYDIDVNIVG